MLLFFSVEIAANRMEHGILSVQSVAAGGGSARPALYFWRSHCSSNTMDGSLLAASLNSSSVIWSSLFLSILEKILSTLCSGVRPSSFIFIMITVPTIL